MEKLAALVPPPRAHLTRYFGVLAPNARARAGVVPPERPEAAGCDHGKGDDDPFRGGEVEFPRRRGRRRCRDRVRWAELLKRTMGLEALECPRCRGRMKVIAAIEEPEVARKILRAMGLPEEAPRVLPARPPPDGQLELIQDSV